MVVQFILKLIFFYFLYTFIKSVVRGYLHKSPASGPRGPQYQEQQQNNARTSASSDVFEAEYKVVKEES